MEKLNQSRKPREIPEETYQKYIELKKQLSESVRAVDGNLIPINQEEFNSIKSDIENLEKQYPHLNFYGLK